MKHLFGLLTPLLFVVSVSAADNQLTDKEKEEGWILLFDGKTLDGWMTSAGTPSRTPVEDGAINPHKCGAYMMVHKEQQDDFVLALDFKLSKGCNSGIFVRTFPLIPRPGKDVGFNGIEVQLLDSKTAGYHDTGAIYDLVKPTKNAMKPVGEWNHIVITCDKNLIAVELNGEKVNRMDLDEWKEPNKRPDGTRHKFDIAYKDHPRKGYIGLQDHGSPCWFKNIKLKPTKAAVKGGVDTQSPFKVVNFPEAGYEFAINRDNGGLAVIVPPDDKIVFYPIIVPTGKLSSTEIKVGKLPIGLLYKQVAKSAFFAVLCYESQEIVVLDAAAPKIIKRIPLTLSGSTSITASISSSDPYVYYSGLGPAGQVGRVNLKTLTDEGPVAAERTLDAVVSADGSLLYGRNALMPSEFQVFRIIDEPKRRFPAARLAYSSSGIMQLMSPWVVSPFGQYVAAGNQVFTPDLRKRLSSLPITSIMFMETQPILVGFQDNGLTAISANSFRTVGTVKIPIKLEDAMPRPGVVPPKTKLLKTMTPQGGRLDLVSKARILEVPGKKTLLVCLQDKVCIVPIVDLKLPSEPFLAVQLEGSLQMDFGQRHVLRVVPKDATVKLELTKGPAGMVLQGNELIWTPTEAEVGTHMTILRVFAEKVEAFHEITLVVSRPAVKLPFSAIDFSLTPDGSFAIVSGYEGKGSRNPALPLPPDVPSRLAVVDLKKRTIIADRKMPVGIGTVAIDGKYVYAALRSSDACYVLNRADLSEVRRIFANGRVDDLVLVPDRLLFISTSQQLQVVKIPSLEPAKPADVGVGIHLTRSGESATVTPPRRVGEGWYYDGCLYDEEMQKLRIVVQPRGFQAIDAPPGWQLAAAPKSIEQTYPEWLAPWSVTYNGVGITRGGRLIGRIPQDAAGPKPVTILREQPAAVSVRCGREWQGGSLVLRAELVLQDLVSGQLALQILLLNEPSRWLPAQRDFFDPPKIQTAPGVCVVLVFDHVFPVKIGKLDPAKFPQLARFRPEVPVEVLRTKDLILPVPRFVGLEAPVEFSLRKELHGLEVDTGGSSVKLEAAKIAGKALETAVKRISIPGLTRLGAPSPGFGAPNPEEVLDSYIHEVKPLFEKLTGQKLQGIPVWLPIALLARDKNSQSAEMDCGVFVEVRVDQVKENAKAQMQQVVSQQQPGNFPVQNLQAQLTSLQQKVQDLEKKIDQMNANIDRLTKELAEKNKTNKKEPKK